MENIFDEIEQLARTERRVAMATLVATQGTAPKKEGSKMWVGEGGHILGSVTIGGCVDARVIEESEEALAESKARLLAVDLGEEDAWDLGLTCAGTIHVMLEPLDLVDPEDPVRKLYETLRGEVEKGKCAVVATLLDAEPSKMLIIEGGEPTGSLGSPDLDREALAAAADLIRKRASRTLTLKRGAAPVQVFFEVHGPAPTLIIFGAGQVSMSLVNLAKGLGFRAVIVDGRPRFATRDRFPTADELLVGIPSEIAASLAYTSSTFVVLAAHDYKYDIPVLKIVLKTSAAYIGLLGSKRRGRAILEFLRESGLDQHALTRVHVPIGLDIGAQTADEIALSILAEAVAVKAGRKGMSMRENG